MNGKKLFGACALASVLTCNVNANANAVNTVLEAIDIYQFYDDVIAKPSELVILKQQISNLYLNESTRYEGFDNATAESLNLFKNALEGQDKIEFGVTGLPSNPSEFFTIKVKGLTKEECDVMAPQVAVHAHFKRVSLNGRLIYDGARLLEDLIQCEKNESWAVGVNEISYVGY